MLYMNVIVEWINCKIVIKLQLYYILTKHVINRRENIGKYIIQ